MAARGRGDTTRRPNRILRGFGYAIVATFMVGFLSGSSTCVYCSGGGCPDDDDDDDFNHNPSVVFGPLPASPPEAYELRDFGILLSEAPGAHPVRRVTDIRGSALVAGLDVAMTEDLLGFSRRVMKENADLLGLPPEAGELRFDGLIQDGCKVGVHYAQVGADFDLPRGAGMLFVFDSDGRLIEIDNTTTIGNRPPSVRER